MSGEEPQEENRTDITYEPFIIEGLVSAGPRKSLLEYESTDANAELCEDCVGFCWIGSRLVFWLCDGASKSKPPQFPIILGKDTLPLRGFSTRILAQDLGQAFVGHMCQSLQYENEVRNIDVKALVFDRVASAWNDRFLVYAPQLSDLIETLAEFPDGARRIDWSSTFIAGVFDSSERKLDIVNYGDSGALIITQPPVVIMPNPHMVTFWAWMRPEASGLQTSIEAISMPEVGWKSFSEVDGFAVMSDGMERFDLADRLNNLREGTFKNLVELRTELLKNTGLTFDDKALLYGRFMGK